MKTEVYGFNEFRKDMLRFFGLMFLMVFGMILFYLGGMFFLMEIFVEKPDVSHFNFHMMELLFVISGSIHIGTFFYHAIKKGL